MRLRTKIVIPLVISAVILFFISEYGVTMLFAISNATREPIPSEDELLSSIVLSRTNELPEVKAFFERYRDADVFVDRSTRVEAYYSIRQCVLKGEPCVDNPSVVEPYSALIVVVDKNANPQRIVLWCVDGEGNTYADKIEHNIVERLKSDTENCI